MSDDRRQNLLDNAVQQKDENNLTVMTMFEQDASVGLTNIDTEDLALPFLKIVSGLDPILDEREDVRKGDILNSVTGDIIKGKDGIVVVPCAYQRKFIQWAPRGQGTGAPVNVFDPNDKMPETKRDENDNREYLTDGSGEYIELTAHWYVKVVNKDGTFTDALIAMKMSQLKKSKKWMSMIMSRQMNGSNGPFVPPMFSHMYRLKTVGEENSKGSWHGWEMSVEGPIQDATLYASAKMFNKSIEKGEVTVKHESDDVGTAQKSAPAKKHDKLDDEIPF
tara:strand:- start:1174 stop:2007 length:834 start_codon:yes stop_codon:yes gene_type:complete